MTTLRRQQLVRLSSDGWARVRDAPWEAGARRCLDTWAARGLPLVVTRQPPLADDRIATGLPAPARFRRQRLAVAVEPRDVLFFDEFPAAEAATPQLPRTLATPWRALLAALGDVGCAPRVYGGYGWQALTRFTYVHADSDLDLLLPVDSAAQADEVARALSRAERGSPPRPSSITMQKERPDPEGVAAWDGPRLDGELLFPDGAAIAWREWLAHREGRAPQVLVKRLRGVALEAPGVGGI